MDLTFGLSRYGPEYAVIGLLVTAIIYLYKKLLEAKDGQIKQAQEENERNQYVRETLQRTSDNIFTFVESHSNKNIVYNGNKQFNKLDNRDQEKRRSNKGDQFNK